MDKLDASFALSEASRELGYSALKSELVWSSCLGEMCLLLPTCRVRKKLVLRCVTLGFR